LPSEQTLKRTPLYEVHREAGARLVAFAGWEMPVQYTSVVAEHLAVRTRAGLFDVSHMGEIEVHGRGALPLLQKLTCNDVGRLLDGQAQYTALTTAAGCFIDDLLVYRFSEDRYLLVVNAANAEKDYRWIRSHPDGEVEVIDRSDDTALLALQGPAAPAIMAPLAEGALGLKRYRFMETLIDGVPAIVGRTGYTGEDGFEIYVPPARAAKVWRRLMEAGRSEGLAPAGLGARDTLRLEAKMALYGNDIDETTSVLEADLGWIVSWEKGDFIGRDELARQRQGGVQRRLVGFEMIDQGIPRHGYPIVLAGRPAGAVTSGGFAPFLRKSIGMAYLPSGHDTIGTRFEVLVRGAALTAQVVPTPFYKRGK